MKRISLLILGALIACMAVEAKKMSDLTVVVDPGHGGYDGDDRPIHIYPYEYNSEESYWESKSNLVKGLHLKNILDSLGVDIHLTRVHNTYNEIDGDDIPDEPSLATRAKMANNLNADMFISIHSNAGENINYPLMIYHLETNMTPRSTESVRMAEIVNDVFNTSVYSNWINYKGQLNTPDPGRVTGDRALLGYSLGVLRNCTVTSMLSEGGMHEHRPQAHRLMNDDYCWLEAWYFAKSIMLFFDTEDRFVTGNIAGVVYDDHNLREFVMPVGINTWKGRDNLAPLNGAHVELFDAAGNLVQERTTDNDYNGVYVFRNIAPGNYTVKVTDDKYYTWEKQVTVVADEVTYQDIAMSYKRDAQLEVKSYSPNVAAEELVSCSSSVDFEFNWDIDEASFEKAFSITPAIEGYFEYHESFHKVSFHPTLSFERNTTYTVTLDKSLCTPDTIFANNTLGSDLTFSFTTKDRDILTMIDNYPKEGGAIHYETPTLEFRFDYKVQGTLSDNTSYTDLIKVYKGDSTTPLAMNARGNGINKLSNNYGNTIIALAENLEVGANYRVVVSGALRDQENLPLRDDVEIEFVAKDVAGAKTGEVVEGFETAGLFVYDADRTVGTGNATPRYAKNTTKLFGAASGKFTYKFNDIRNGEVVWNYTDTARKIVHKGDVLGMHVYGDFNNHELWVGVTSGTDTKYEKLCDLTFRGWEYFEITLSTLEEGYDYSFSNIKLVQVQSPITQSGNFSIDDMVVVCNHTGSVENITVNGDINVYPVPANDVINVDAQSEIVALEVVNIQGVVVAEALASNQVAVDHLSQGVYLLRIHTVNGTVVRRVAISR